MHCEIISIDTVKEMAELKRENKRLKEIIDSKDEEIETLKYKIKELEERIERILNPDPDYYTLAGLDD